MIFVVIARDKPGMADVRARTRPAHLDYMLETSEHGRNIIGLPLATDDGSAMIGTLYLIEAVDRANAEAFANGDPYVKAGIFDSVEVIAGHPVFDKELKRILPRGAV